MRIDILTVMPEALESPLHCSILQRAQDKGLVEIHVHNLRDWSLRKHRKVDDYPFGGEAGMVMQIEPVWRCMEELKSQRDYDEIIFTSPDGEQLDQPMANALSLKENLEILLSGHQAKIAEWKMQMSLERTRRLRPNLLKDNDVETNNNKKRK